MGDRRKDRRVWIVEEGNNIEYVLGVEGERG